VVPNFTTRNLGWLRNPETVTRIKATAGSFAYSVQSVADVRKLGVALRAAKWNDEESDGPKPVIHVVMGTVVRRTFEAILKEANKQELGVTLLGWKRTGRATEEARHPYLDWWWESVKAHGSWRLGIDTALAAEAEAKGDLAELPSYSYHTEDGKYSCYIDAVAGVIAASSWEPQRGSFPFAEDWLAVFAALS
jgi:hypothetical protein